MADEMKLLNILIIEDRGADYEWIATIVKAYGVERVERAENRLQAEAMLATGQFNCAIIDVKLPEGQEAGLEILEDRRFDAIFKIMLTEWEEHLTKALLHGARRFIAKRELVADADRLKLALYDASMFVKSRLAVYYQSQVMSEFFRKVATVARKEDPVLIMGESGTGKDLVARAIHKISSRSAGPFEVLNCACLDPTSAEADLFGVQAKGFTDTGPRPGVFERADRGTAFFDEIGELAVHEQKRLLVILEHPEELMRAGGSTRVNVNGRPVSFRCLFATDRDLEREIETRGFHGPLYERMSRQILRVPPLNERREDIPLLVWVFLRGQMENAERLSNAAVDALAAANWRGRNVRGLWNTIARALVLAETREDSPSAIVSGDDITAAMQSADVQPVSRSGFFSERVKKAEAPLTEVEANYIAQVLQSCGGKVADAAKTLDIGRNTLYEKIRRYGLEDLLAAKLSEKN